MKASDLKLSEKSICIFPQKELQLAYLSYPRRNPEHSLSDDGKLEELSFLYNLRQNFVPLVSFAMQGQRNEGEDSLHELLLVLAGIPYSSLRVLALTLNIGLEGGQKCASEILYQILVTESHAPVLFARIREKYLNFYSDVYR